MVAGLIPAGRTLTRHYVLVHASLIMLVVRVAHMCHQIGFVAGLPTPRNNSSTTSSAEQSQPVSPVPRDREDPRDGASPVVAATRDGRTGPTDRACPADQPGSRLRSSRGTGEGSGLATSA